MHQFRQLSLIEQIAEHLRQGFLKGHWCGQLPGVRQLVSELGVSKDSVEAAIRMLESEGSLKSGGVGRRKEIAILRETQGGGRKLRVGILLSNPLNKLNLASQQTVLQLIRQIENTGHTCFIAERCMSELGNKLPRISRMVEAAKADAWVAYVASHDVLNWFVDQSIPVIALGGASQNLPIASTRSDINNALGETVRKLSELGHRRIVTISPMSWRVPEINHVAKSFLSAMAECGHEPSSYHLPSWDQTPAGLEKLLDSLFRLTPPSALLFVEAAYFAGALEFLGSRRRRIPEDISVVTLTSSPVFEMMAKRPAHFQWPLDQHVRRVIRWLKCLSKGVADVKQVSFPAVFEPGETIGPAKN